MSQIGLIAKVATKAMNNFLSLLRSSPFSASILCCLSNSFAYGVLTEGVGVGNAAFLCLMQRVQIDLLE